MKLALTILVPFGMLAACGEAPRNPVDTPEIENRMVAEQAVPPSETGDGTTDENGDACGASQYQHLVGQPRSAIPPEPDGASWRVACTTCPITMDYRADRMNIFYDEESGTIEEVRCG
jgi:hypothetical protein